MIDVGQPTQAARAPREFTRSASFLAKRVGIIAKERTLDAFEGVGAAPFAYPVLALLGQGACTTQAAIADSLRLDRSYLVGLLDELEGEGLIERKRDAHDRRRHVVTLTGAGERELVRLRGIVHEVDAELLAPLTAAERKTLQELLGKLAAAHDPRYRLD
jgi:MarR family transcriptional regulator, lower aerobic nicotinate degradation pathway regulator